MKRNQFGLPPYSIDHKPTVATFTPDPANPYSGIIRLAHLYNVQPNGGFKPDEVCRVMEAFARIIQPSAESGWADPWNTTAPTSLISTPSGDLFRPLHAQFPRAFLMSRLRLAEIQARKP